MIRKGSIAYHCVFTNYRPEFWDVVVITARDDSQRIIYDYQIDQKKKRREIPSFVR